MRFFDSKSDPEIGYVQAPTSEGLVIESHGARIFGLCLAPALYSSEERRPVVVMCHGMPGVDPNADLAQALRRAGFFVIYFRYRGMWGSQGTCSFTHVIEDVRAVVEYVRSGKINMPIDFERIYLLGHSVGGFAVLNALANGLKVKRAVLMAPCNLSYRYRFNYDSVLKSIKASYEKGYYHLPHADALMEDLAKNAASWDFATLASRLPRETQYHFICGMQDGVCPAEKHVGPLLDDMEKRGMQFTYCEWDDGHAFHATRVHLSDVIVDLLKEE